MVDNFQRFKYIRKKKFELDFEIKINTSFRTLKRTGY